MPSRGGRALTPSGIILVDKPAGPTSFAIVAAVRRRHRGAHGTRRARSTRSRPGSCSSSPGRRRSCSPGSSDSTSATSRRSTSERERRPATRKARSSTGTSRHLADELEEDVARLQGVVGLPIPAASAVKIDGERAYRLHRRGVVVEMPIRQMTIHELELAGYEDGVASLELHVSSGTYVRSIAEALGGHCRSLRRTEIGPFSVDEADPNTIVPADEALARLG